MLAFRVVERLDPIIQSLIWMGEKGSNASTCHFSVRPFVESTFTGILSESNATEPRPNCLKLFVTSPKVISRGSTRSGVR